MPQLRQPPVFPAVEAPIEFVAPVGLDLLNSMYFTFLARDFEGVASWPVETRRRMDPALRAELDALFTYPRGEPGIMGALTDTSFVHRDVWAGVDGVMRHLRDLPADGTPAPQSPGIRGLATYALRWPCDVAGDSEGPELVRLDRAAFAVAVAESETSAPDAMDLYDDPEGVRARMLALIRRFYDEHYRPDEQRRVACMQRSADAHRAALSRDSDPQRLMDDLAHRHINCLEMDDSFRSFVFVPSLDVGAYNSCAETSPVHGFFYACEREFIDPAAPPATDAERLALVYKALADEQRLRILGLLRARGELYAQEIVEATGVAQSVVSRHLTFMRAVGLVVARRQNNMKFYSINHDMRDELARALDVFAPPARTRRKERPQC